MEPAQFASTFKSLLAKGVALGEEGAQLQDEDMFTLLWERVRRWEDQVGRFLAESVGPEEKKRFETKQGQRIMRDAAGNFNRHVIAKLAFLTALKEAVEHEPAMLRIPASATTIALEPPTGSPTSRAFIVHGADELNRHRLERMLRELKMDPIVLRYEPGKGRTLIEKFEEEASSCKFAFVIMTPDDHVTVYRYEGENYVQSRPNVIFELGWFYGRLRRSNVCILFKKGTKLHSDLEGISRVEFVDSVEEKALEIQAELRAVGLIP